jgi:hypothetical protein
MPAGSIEIAELLALHLDMTWAEALALVQAVGAGRSGDVLACRLFDNGLAGPPAHDVRIPKDVTVSALADLLHRLLPPPSDAAEPRVPPALRYTVLRALGQIAAPGFASVDEWREKLVRFERAGRTELLKALFLRAVARRTAESSPPGVVTQGSRPARASSTVAQAPAAAAPPSVVEPEPTASAPTWPPASPSPADTAGSWDALVFQEVLFDPAGELLVHPGLAEMESAAGPTSPRRAGVFLTALVALSILNVQTSPAIYAHGYRPGDCPGLTFAIKWKPQLLDHGFWQAEEGCPGIDQGGYS